MEWSIQDLLRNTTFKTSRSGGKGGQNVNKVSSKVELNYDFEASVLFDSLQKIRLKQKLANRMTSDGLIQIISEEERSQYLNKERAIVKLNLILQNALHVEKARKKTKPKKSSIEQRLNDKLRQAAKKLNRRKSDLEL